MFGTFKKIFKIEIFLGFLTFSGGAKELDFEYFLTECLYIPTRLALISVPYLSVCSIVSF